MSLHRRDLLKSAVAAPFVLSRGRAQEPKPNVVFFMTDDHGAWASGAYGCRDIHTPHIDSLARQGARFDRAFAATPVCSPSRLTYFTGKLPSHHGAQDWIRPEDSFGPGARRFLEPGDTFTELLAARGYTVGLSGKWHMGGDEHAHAGFTYWHTIPGGGGPYRNVRFLTNGVLGPARDFKTDAVGDGALDFLDRFGDRPFFLYVPFYAPHTPLDYQPEVYRAPYGDSSFPCFPAAPMHPWQNPGLDRHFDNRDSQLGYSALVTAADANVGRVLAKLDQLGVRENTLVIFTADQGFNCGHHGVWGKGNGTVPFNMYEESIRVPLIWTHPGRIRAGLTIPAMVSTYDFYHSILDYLGIPAPTGREKPGRSYAPWLRGETPDWTNRLFFEYSYVRALRTETLKLVERVGDWPSELFDLEADPAETRNVIGESAYRERLAALRAQLHGFFTGIGAPPPEEWRGTTTQNLTVYTPRASATPAP